MVWLTQMCASMPHDDDLSRAGALSAARKAAAPHELKAVFSIGSNPAGSASRISLAVRPKPFGYCSVTMTGTPKSCCAARDERNARRRFRKVRDDRAKRLLHVYHGERRAAEVERVFVSHDASPTEESI